MRRKKIRVICFLAVLTVLFGAAFLMLQTNRRATADVARTEKLGALLRLTEYTQSLSPELEKAAVLSSPSLFSEHLGAIIENAACARISLDSLTDGTEDYAGLYRIYRQVSDFALYLQRELSAGRALPAQRRESLHALAAFTQSLTKQLTLLSIAVMAGEKSLENAGTALSKAKSPLLADGLPDINKALDGLPKLIYDGPFSDSEAAPEGAIDKKGWVSKEKAAEIAAKYLDTKPVLLRALDEQDTPYPAYCWYFGNKGVKVAKKGGILTELSQAVHAGAAKLTDAEVHSAAAKHLKKLGFADMRAVSAKDADGVRTMEYVYDGGGVLCYPDTVKVSVAMDTGEVVGLDAGAYVINHVERNLPRATLSAAAALRLVPDSLEAEDRPRLALIPKGKAEVLCWELLCRGNGTECLFYLSAEDGKEEDVLLVMREGETMLFR
ncbi:MAG: germination protein YpeB [Oscillospiraceae bacterium]|nr:germination protein YpeB [Oscillospiraceae bacterium]